MSTKEKQWTPEVERYNALTAWLEVKFSSIDDRFDEVDKRFDRVEGILKAMCFHFGIDFIDDANQSRPK